MSNLIINNRFKLEQNKDKIIKAYQSGKSLSKIVKEFDLGKKSLKTKLKEWNIRNIRYKPSKIDKFENEILDYFNKGLNCPEIAKIFNCSKCTIHRFLEKNNININLNNKSHKKGKENRKWTGYEDISGSFWKTIINGAIDRNIEFSINIKEIWNLFLEQNKKCALSGLDLYFQSSTLCRDGVASLDRIDSKKGYIKGNIQWVHKDVNKMKMDLEQDKFVILCGMIFNLKKDKND